MKKEQFLRELEALLQNISENERAEAMQYYMDYFDDAGPDHEEEIIEELESPEKVARTIREGLGENDGEFSERGYEDRRFAENQELGPRAAASKAQQEKEKKSANGWKITSIILLCILLSPVILPIGIAVLGILIALIACIVALGVGVGAVAFALLVAGIVVIGIGIARVFLVPAVGLALAGTGFLLLALGVLVTVAVVWCCVKILPWAIRGIVGLLQYPFRKRKGAVQG